MDKHDLFRNSVPGFIFLIVILSFYAITESLDKICGAQGGGQAAILSLISGFPLGFIIQSLYRIIFHVGSGEQASLDKFEASLVENMFSGSDRDKAHFFISQTFEPGNKHWRERINFMYSYIHSLGASVLAIALALIVLFSIKYPLSILCCECSIDSSFSFRIFLTTAAWVLIAIVFYCGRKHVKETVVISSRVFWKLRKKG